MDVIVCEDDGLTTDDLALIDRVRQRFLDACSARWPMPNSMHDAMALVAVVERPDRTTAAKSSLTEALLTEEESVELTAVRERHKLCVLRTTHTDRDTLLLFVERIIGRFSALRDEYDVRCDELCERDSRITTLESDLRLMQNVITGVRDLCKVEP